MDAYFAHERHLVCYTPATVLGRIDAILGDYARYESIARQGQEACRAGHTSRVRAGELLGHIQAGTARNTRMDAPARQCAEACARYFLCLRFGGQFRGSVAALNAISQGGGEAGARAAYILGDIHARTDRREAARHFYTQAAEKGYAFFPQSKMTLLLLQENKFQEAKTSLTSALTALPAEAAALQAELKMLPDSDAQPAALLFLLARAYAALGRIFYTGFLKQTADNFPDTALELASLAWEQSHAAAVLDFMLECAAGCGVAGELLPQLCYAIEHGLADDRQILLTAELAKQYYDQDLALRILSALRKTKEG